MIERGCELEAAAADVRQPLQQFDRAVDRHGLAGLLRFLAVDQHAARRESAPAPSAAIRRGRARPAADRCAAWRRFFMRAPLDDQIGDLAQPVARGRQRCRRRDAPHSLLLGHLARPLESVNRRERDLALLGVLAGGLAESFGRLLHVENVVDDLKRQPDMFAIAGQRRRTAPRCAPA